MTKQELLTEIRARLSGLPASEIEDRLAFYGESIEDRIEDGLTEEEAVSAMGTADEIVTQILAEIPLGRLVKEKVRPKRRLGGLEIALLAIGSPIWFSLAVAALAVVLSLYVALWAVVISLWAVFASLVACAFVSTVGGIAFVFSGNTPVGLSVFGAGLFCLGLSIFMFFGCKEATKGTAILAKKILLGIKFAFIGKEKTK